ncbi:unnamed protein product [Ectocarpus sp. CCAP 1310/34]|nr:unnamed protein product [Ectocarpus sp. CCAP 1310/34]
MDMRGDCKHGDGTEEQPRAGGGRLQGGVRSQNVLQREVSAAVDGLNWPPLAPRGWAPLRALAAFPSPAGGDAGGGGGSGGGGERGKTLKILTWNVLCDGLSGAHPERGGFVYAPEGSLDWEKRRWRLLEEILRWDCDVLVLQEVDHHHDWLSPMLAKQGYRSLFVKKPLAPGMAFNPHLEDGCSLFYRATAATTTAGDNAADSVPGKRGAEITTKLDLLDAHSFSLAVVETEDDTAGDNSGGDGGGGGGEGGRTDKADPPAEPVVGNQVALISLLGVSSPGRGGEGRGEDEALVIVTTTHLKAKKDGHGELIRSRQAKQLLDEVARFRAGQEKARGLPAGSVPVIIAGDFNATPHASGGYEPLCYGQITSHPLALRSALPLGDDLFTTWKVRAAGGGGVKESRHCIDYVWLSEGLRPVEGSTLPSAEGLGLERAPSFAYPSDHFAIAVDLRLP